VGIEKVGSGNGGKVWENSSADIVALGSSESICYNSKEVKKVEILTEKS
jgi:hypothetical protein